MNSLRLAVNEMGLSARAHDKVLRLSRTIADLEGTSEIRHYQLNKAVNFRMLDRDVWK